ncbi:DUF6252 family protein [Flavobacterium sp. CBA20B-1]|uniref:DUF6252 family protein n=1 Tax=unclassified Flavobacterium TaxID=196869 RepID=UPI0022259D5D|nr:MULTISPECIES: DUF6252 family protein [unclassified Flavobacterium]WCM41453.1 DUF6252 family protein [Flavobacterium sp. CBA20B-1]
MKKLLFILATIAFFVSCNKDDQAPQPEPQIAEIDKLPPATQTGANKIGCLVNGKAFLPKGQLTGSSNPYCAYYHDAFVLIIRIVKNEGNITGNGTESVAIYSSDIILEENMTYSLKEIQSRKNAVFAITGGMAGVPDESYETNEDYKGELHITKLDKEKNIISGTFWFDAVNEQSEKVEIREGRFDMKFEGWAG